METDGSFIDYSFINFSNTESLLTTSQYAKVIFHNIEDKYDLNADLICQYSLTEQFSANPGDRIVLFRLGWQQVTDYVLFEWAKLPKESSTLEIQFQADSLPRDTNEFYQLCYISGANAVCGASVPFQFAFLSSNLITSTCSECFVALGMESLKTAVSTSGISSANSLSSEADTTLNLAPNSTTPTTSINSPNHSDNLSTITSDLEQLRTENKQLKTELHSTNASLQRCDSEISELKQEIATLKSMLKVTQNDVNDLKVRMDCANDDYKKMIAEKLKVEKKYDKLVKKCQGRTRKSVDSSGEFVDDFLGELEPLPPFPLLM